MLRSRCRQAQGSLGKRKCNFGGEGLNLSLTNQDDNPLNSAFREIIVVALQTGLNGTLGHMWPPSHGLPTSELDWSLTLVVRKRRVGLESSGHLSSNEITAELLVLVVENQSLLHQSLRQRRVRSHRVALHQETSAGIKHRTRR